MSLLRLPRMRDLHTSVRRTLRQSYYRAIAPVHGWQAGRVRQRLVGTAIAITGSVGKSTTTWLIAQALRGSGSVQVSLGLNVERSVYRTLRVLAEPTDYLVQEISAFPPGSIARVGRSITFDAAVITTIGLDHLSEFISEAGVAAEKSKLIQTVRPDGLVGLNIDYPLIAAMKVNAGGRRVVTYGYNPEAEVRAEAVTAQWPQGLQFDLIIGERRRRVRTRFVGTLAVQNFLASFAVAHGLGLDIDTVVERLSVAEPLAHRGETFASVDGNTYVLDTAKASMWSARLFVEDLAKWGDGHRILVMGNLSDKGNDAPRKYRQILRSALRTCDLVIGIEDARGPAERLAAAIAREASDTRREPRPQRAFAVRDFAEAQAIIAAAPRGLVILKGNGNFPLEPIVPDAGFSRSELINRARFAK
ncbi:MAG: Mur ligase family protein [Devosia sp.]